jgi:hypothetical protein
MAKKITNNFKSDLHVNMAVSHFPTKYCIKTRTLQKSTLGMMIMTIGEIIRYNYRIDHK